MNLDTMNNIINELSVKFMLPNLGKLKNQILLDHRVKSVNISSFENEVKRLFEWYLEIFYKDEYLLNINVDEAALVIECREELNNYIFKGFFYISSESNNDYIYFPLSNLKNIQEIYLPIFEKEGLNIYYELTNRISKEYVNL